MKILIAGATGAIGKPLIHFLQESGYEVYGITQSPKKATMLQEKGVKPVLLNIFEKDAVLSSVKDIKPQVVIDMLTRLPKEYTPQAMKEASLLDAETRIVGGGNLHMASELLGVERYIAQSAGFWYEEGVGLATENTPFAFKASPGISAGCDIYKQIEDRIFQSKNLDGVALRFGFFYGPGTWFCPKDNIEDQLHKQSFPIIDKGQGVWNFVHIEDAAKSIIAALDCEPGAYNIINDHPSPMNEWLPAFASYVGAPRPPSITIEEGIKQKGEDFVYYATRLRGASNEKAKRALKFQSRAFEWLI